MDGENGLAEGGDGLGFEAALTTLYQLEATIEARKNEIVAEGMILWPDPRISATYTLPLQTEMYLLGFSRGVLFVIMLCS